MTTQEKVQNYDPFNPPRREFRACKKNFQYEFIPSCHFQKLVVKCFALMTGAGEDDKKGNKTNRVEEVLTSLLSEDVYEIMLDVILYQNEDSVGEIPNLSIETLRKRTSPTEISTFTLLMLEDPSIIASIMRFVDGLGKMTTSLPGMEALSQTVKSTLSSPTHSDLAERMSINDLVTP